jgi:hypothetical protein
MIYERILNPCTAWYFTGIPEPLTPGILKQTVIFSKMNLKDNLKDLLFFGRVKKINRPRGGMKETDEIFTSTTGTDLYYTS